MCHWLALLLQAINAHAAGQLGDLALGRAKAAGRHTDSSDLAIRAITMLICSCMQLIITASQASASRMEMRLSHRRLTKARASGRSPLSAS